MNILIVDKLEQTAIDALKRSGASVTCEQGAEGLPAAIARVRPEILVVRSTKIQAPALQNASDLRLIIRAGAGVDNIDVAAASARGIRVCNCPGMNAIAVAELTMGLLLACDRRIPDQTAEIRAGTWNKKGYGTGARGLKGSTLGVIGLGAIGEAVVHRARAFEMSIVGWSRSLTEAGAKRLGVRFGGNTRAALLAMLPSCDAVSLHLALTPETKQFCNREFFAAMRTGSYFINTGRGGLVDEAALREFAASKGLRCGLDVYEAQPGAPQGEFKTTTSQIPGSAFTHHTGASTAQAQQAVADEVVRIVSVYTAEGRAENCVNPDAQAVGNAAGAFVDVRTSGAAAASGASPKASR